jgi:hypothetical protein
MDLRRIFKVLVSFLILLGEFCWECFMTLTGFITVSPCFLSTETLKRVKCTGMSLC